MISMKAERVKKTATMGIFSYFVVCAEMTMMRASRRALIGSMGSI